MEKIINLAVKFSGLGWIWEKTDGYKTYGSAAIGILTGVLGLSIEFGNAIAGHDAGAIFRLIQHLPADPSWLALVSALGLLGVGHKLEKSAPEAPKP